MDSKIFQTNYLTKWFIDCVQTLINGGTEVSEIIEKLSWNKSTFSLVRNGKRDIPIKKLELFIEVFGFEKPFEEKKDSQDIVNENGAVHNSVNNMTG